MMSTSDKAAWINHQLPPIEKFKIRGEADYYGASNLIAKTLGKPRPPRSFAYWTHGWIYTDRITNPRELTFWGNQNDTVLITTEDQAEILRDFGYSRVVAVGLPFIYGNSKEVERRSGSLLVMPAHSLPYTNHKWNEVKYVSEILQFSSCFSEIIFCLHSACISKKAWIETLDKFNIPWIIGASLEDKNALQRINIIFNSFEYMTTNTVGSHLVYAAYSGCKVSIFGEFAGYQLQDFKNDPWYQKYPDILEKRVKLFKECNFRKQFPHLFVSPMESSDHQSWGEKMIGYQYKKSAREIAHLLGWSPQGQTKGYFRKGLGKVKEHFKS